MTLAVSTQLTVPATGRDHMRGSPTAVVTLVEYGDYACPHCNRARWVMKRLMAAVGNRMSYAFRNFPIPILQPKHHRGALAAEAAGAQNRFWEMHDRLFDHQAALSDKHLRVYATQVGLDMERFNRDMLLETFAPRVSEDHLSGSQSGVNTTPAFFINDRMYIGHCNFDTMLSRVEEVLRTVPR